ncbi:pyridoxal phosphate-dependent aminotransferase [Kitasatospora sp. NPDC058965]|uniref:pyridoxal phosphate-dependent aminotransferase n=1 Tax=Kitasatospora sp. NPDC058965 TaxID=3346682 RepID=UPI0036C37788
MFREDDSARDGALARLGGGLNTRVVAGRATGLIEKRHLVLKRWYADQAARRGAAFLDFGTDYGYPFYDKFRPTLDAMDALGRGAESARHYPSSYGTAELREEFRQFMHRQFEVTLDPHAEVMVTTGASQAFDAITRSYAGRYLLVPELALSTVTSIGVGNGAEVVRVPMDQHFRPVLAELDAILERIGGHDVRCLYINSPTNPTGTVLGREYLTELVALARRHGVLVLHDHDSWYTVHRGERSVNILEIPGAMDVAVTVLSVSKELGLPGLRVGLMAGNPSVINDLRIHNSEFCVMIPEFCQDAVAAALRASTDDGIREDVQDRISAALTAAVQGWRDLGWPEDALLPPQAGYKFLLRPPAGFDSTAEGELTGVDTFDFLLAREAGVKLSTSRSFNAGSADWMRMIIMQDVDVVEHFFERLAAIGVHYRMTPPTGLAAQLREIVSQFDLWDL